MVKFVKRRSEKAGLPPGTLVHVGEKIVERIRIAVIDYDAVRLTETEVERVEDCFPYKDIPGVTWINVTGLHDVEVIRKLGEHFGIHPLLQEDIVNTDQRPKMEDFETHALFVLKMLSYDREHEEVRAEQVSLVLGPDFVISFEEREGDVFGSVRERLRAGKGRLRKAGSDYLTYALLDAIVDSYFIILEEIGESVEGLEQELIDDPKPGMLEKVNVLKRELIFLRKSVWPLRELVGQLERGESSLIQEATEVYLRDIYDHTVHIIDTIETYRDVVSSMIDIYLSSLSNRMNGVMKVLTIIATIFIPLTFIAGVYGMNFANMPELRWQWGYFVAVAAMAAIGGTMAIYFKIKRWF